MNEVEYIKRRMKQRKKHVLNDRHFKKFYNLTIKIMVAMVIGISTMTYFKIHPNHTMLKQFLFQNIEMEQFKQTFTKWLMPFLKLESFDIPVVERVDYQHIEKNLYKSNSNEVKTLDEGTVVYIGNQDILGNYLTIQGISGVKITYGKISHLDMELYDYVKMNETIGSYDENIMIIFEYGGKEISYEEAKQYI